MTDAAMFVPALAMALLHFLWQGALLGLLAWLALAALRGARPQLRYAVACTALAACAALPAWHLVAALSQAGALPSAIRAVTPGDGVAAWNAALRMGEVTTLPASHAALPWIVALWAVGCAAFSLRMAFGLHWVRRLRADAADADSAWQARFEALAARMGVVRRVALRVTGSGDTPLAIGWWRPLVLVPAALAARMPADLLEALLAHELAHVRRHDYLVNLLQGAVEVLLFYHPVVWWLSRRIRIERELVADELAADALGDRRRLALALVELDRLSTPRSPFPHTFAQAAQGGQLMPRIRQLIRPDRRNPGAALVLPLLGLAAAGSAFYVHAHQAEAPTVRVLAAEVAKPVTAAGQAGPTVAIVRAGDRAGYALVRKGEDGFLMSGDMDDADAIRAAQRGIDGDFLWFRRDGKVWVVRDAAAVERARAAWQPAEPLQAQMRALDGKMRPHGERMQALGERMQALDAGAGAETPEMQAASEKMQALAAEMEALAQRQMALALDGTADSDAAKQEAIARELGARQQALQQEMARESAVIEAAGRRLQAQQAPMQALGREMEAEGRPMQAIGEEMEAVGKQIERVAKVADAEVRTIIDDAWKRGLAMPAPGKQ